MAVAALPLIAPGLAAQSDSTATMRPALRVCADPNNMPFSNRAGEGFENRIARVLAGDLGETPAYTWWAQRRGFIRSTLSAHQCDIVIGIVANADRVLTTRPYYRSTYVFVTRRDRGLVIRSFDDPRLRTLRIGLHVIGADYNSLPPGVALAQRGLVHNVVGYSIYGNYAAPSPPSALIAAVGRGDVDVAIAWGPLAGYYARRSPVPLVVTPVATATAGNGIPFVYDIAIGVRPGDQAFANRLAGILTRRRREVDRILREYGVPTLTGPTGGAATEVHPTARRRGGVDGCVAHDGGQRCA